MSSTALAQHPAWLSLRDAANALQLLQRSNGSIADEGGQHQQADLLVATITGAIASLSPSLPHDQAYHQALLGDIARWRETRYPEPDFLDSLLAFRPELQRIDGLEHLVVFPMFTQNGSPDRHLEAVLLRVVWPQWIADLEAGRYDNEQFVPVAFTDFTAGYDTNSAVLFPETVAAREVPIFTWGAIFCDREAARFRRVAAAVAEATRMNVPDELRGLLDDHQLTQETFVAWDLVHDRTHSRGDLPFDPFMIKQRMPFWLYSLEELRCDLTAFRAGVDLERDGNPAGRRMQLAIVIDRAFRFPLSGNRVRNYDGLGGQLLFAHLRQNGVMHWTDNRLTVEWDRLADSVLALLAEIEQLYWRGIDRSKVSHWLATYRFISATVDPNPASRWAKGPDALPLEGPPKGLTDAVLPDEFPLSLFFESLAKRVRPVIESTRGIAA
jgi:hypothetical protein